MHACSACSRTKWNAAIIICYTCAYHAVIKHDIVCSQYLKCDDQHGMEQPEKRHVIKEPVRLQGMFSYVVITHSHTSTDKKQQVTQVSILRQYNPHCSAVMG